MSPHCVHHLCKIFTLCLLCQDRHTEDFTPRFNVYFVCHLVFLHTHSHTHTDLHSLVSGCCCCCCHPHRLRRRRRRRRSHLRYILIALGNSSSIRITQHKFHIVALPVMKPLSSLSRPMLRASDADMLRNHSGASGAEKQGQG